LESEVENSEKVLKDEIELFKRTKEKDMGKLMRDFIQLQVKVAVEMQGQWQNFLTSQAVMDESVPPRKQSRVAEPSSRKQQEMMMRRAQPEEDDGVEDLDQ